MPFFAAMPLYLRRQIIFFIACLFIFAIRRAIISADYCCRHLLYFRQRRLRSIAAYYFIEMPLMPLFYVALY